MRLIIFRCYFTLFFIAQCIFFSPESQAACTRKINVAFSPAGHLANIEADKIFGVLPDLLSDFEQNKECQFNFSVVPRARQELMFRNGQADLLIPAVRTSRRDAYGTFVPLSYTRVSLISLQSEKNPILSMRELLDRKSITVVVVRGYDYGDTYLKIIHELKQQGRLIDEADPVSAARTLKVGIADYAIMAPYVFSGEVQSDTRVRDMADKLRYEIIPEISWVVSGLYLSKKSLNTEDTKSLISMFQNASKSGLLWKKYQHYYDTAVLNLGLKPY